MAVTNAERRFSEHVLGSWSAGATSLRRPLVPEPVPDFALSA
jgi:hypothetical protein